MHLIKAPIRNRQFTWIVVIMIVVMAGNILFHMPRAEDPTLKAPQFPVVVVYPGTSPKDLEEMVVKPLENRFYALDDIKKIQTSVANGVVSMVVEYEFDVDYDDKYQ